LGGGLAVLAGSAGVSFTTIGHNQAVGGNGGAGASNGNGVGGGVYAASKNSVSVIKSVIKNNHASTSNDDLFP
jgi:hypothetical protein